MVYKIKTWTILYCPCKYSFELVSYQAKLTILLLSDTLFGFQEELRAPQESQHGDAVMESIVKKRNGSVLGKGSILKMYFFPGQRTSSNIQIHSAPHVYKVSSDVRNIHIEIGVIKFETIYLSSISQIGSCSSNFVCEGCNPTVHSLIASKQWRTQDHIRVGSPSS